MNEWLVSVSLASLYNFEVSYALWTACIVVKSRGVSGTQFVKMNWNRVSPFFAFLSTAPSRQSAMQISAYKSGIADQH